MLPLRIAIRIDRLALDNSTEGANCMLRGCGGERVVPKRAGLRMPRYCNRSMGSPRHGGAQDGHTLEEQAKGREQHVRSEGRPNADRFSLTFRRRAVLLHLLRDIQQNPYTR